MEIVTSSAGIQYVLNQIHHEPVVHILKPVSQTYNAFPSLKSTNSVYIPKNHTFSDTSGYLKTLVRSNSSLGVSNSVSAPRRRNASMQYDPINDPHLKDYFERKFKLSNAKKKREKPRKPGPNELIYRVKVKTGNCNNASTDANVYITICGQQGNLQRKQLFNKYNAIRTEEGYKFKFERNTVNIFKLIGIDIGPINNIIIEHDGKDLHSSWFLQEVIVTNTKTNRSWLFECNDWLSLHHGLGKSKIQLLPNQVRDPYFKTDYKIVVITGDKQGAGTDANVFITLFGPRNKSTQRLELSSNDRNLFERGKTDTFKLTNVDYVGPIKKVRIEHDNTGKSPGWFLERLVITDLKDPKTNFYCPCSNWLDKNEGDGQISRDLIATDDPFSARKNTKYRITVYTGDKRNAGTDADVNVVLYGTYGDSGDWKLDNKGNNFERGKKDEFIIELPSLGELKKLKIGHNNKNLGSGWYLNKVIVDDNVLNRVYEFNCDRWLAVDEEDGKTTVFLYPGVSGVSAEPGVPYNIYLYTADEKHAGTSSKVYIEMFGGRHGEETTEKIWLNNPELKKGKMHKVQIQSPKMLSPLSKLLIGHDNSGPSPDWLLEQVVVETPQLGMKQYFPCQKWLSKQEADGRIERILKENTSLRETHGAKSVWEARVYTSSIKKAGTDANVFLCLYGDKGKSDEIQLKSENKKLNLFESGSCDNFKIETNDIGKPFKLRVSHDNTGSSPGWHLDRIELENLNDKEIYYFVCQRWLARDEEDGQIVRELPAEGDSIKKPLPVVNYIVEVYTGKKSGAGTNSDVFLNIFGEMGDTGERLLEKSLTNKDKFEKNKVDVFNIEAVSLKKFKKIRIGHNGKRAGAGWFLDKVVVKQENNPKYDQVFECNRWLAVDEDDGLIVRELFADGGSQFLDSTTYNIKIKTGDVRNAGTDAKVSLKIYGDKGDTGERVLKSSDNASNPFERSKLDEFKLEAGDVGKIDKIFIGHDGKGPGAGWFLDYVEIDVPSKGLRYKFSAHRWLDEKEDDGQTAVELYPSEVQKMKKFIPYVITIKTGDKRGSGTDANVFIQLYGIDGKSEERFLDNKTNNFERGQEDVFKIEAEDVGPLYKVRIGHDNKGASSGWFLEKMKIQRQALKGSKRLKNSRRSSTVSSESELENYYFFVNKWFAKDEDDGQIIRELTPTDEDGRPLIELDEVPYEVKVFTGDKRGAGTDANVFLNIYGENGDAGERELKKSENINKFERNQIDTFKIKAIELGELHKIKIRHDNKGGSAAWYLEKVEIFNPNTNRTYLFNCQNWLSETDGDGKISRELPAIDPAQLKRVKFRQGANSLKDQFLLETEAITTTYNVHVKTSDVRNAGTDANVYIQLFGDKNDSGKIPLETSKTNKNKFERGNEDIFEIKEADVGDLRKIRIGHDGRGPGDGWHLKEVIIDAPKLGKKWRFPCARWLDKNEDDGKIERELFPMDVSFEEYNPFVPYEITVYTSDKRGADTSANPYIVLYGEEIRTKQYDLCKNKSERSGKFKRAAIDKFVLEMEDVGKEITKIRIGHDDKGMSSGWHVDKVEIRRLKQNGKGSKIFVFPCNRWLARDEEDKAIERDLVASKIIDEKFENGEVKTKEKEVRDHLEMKEYVVDIYTGNVSGAGTNANVYLTLFGDFGDSGEKKLLKSETHRDKFEKNQMDRFLIQTADLGQLFKLIVRHDDSGFSSDWFLDKIEVTDGRDKYLFLCERWLSKSKEDKQIERTLFEKNYKGPRITSTSSLALKSNIGGSKLVGSDPKLSIRQHSPFGNHPDYDGPTIPYKIIIRTGDEKNCGISSQAFIRLFGERKNQKTDRIMLQLAKKKRFEPGSSETFQIETLDIGNLTQIELGHDGVGPSESWFVKHIEIIESIKGRSYLISCNSWFSTEKGDGLTIRRFNVDEATTKISSYRGLIPYTLTIYTGDVPKAGTDSNVTLKFFGSKGNTDDIFIEKVDNRFDRAAIDSLNIEIDDIGPLKKMRVSHDGKGSRKEWFLDRIEMTNQKTKRQYAFVSQEWLSKSREGSRGLTIDVPLFKNDGKTIDTTSYKIMVKTSDISGAGTDANVFVNIFGENGDSGELELKKSETNMNKFERGRTDVFSFDNILSLGELTKLRIWHDNSGSLIGNTHWHLDSVIVEDLTTRKTYLFDCKKWLSKSKDDKQIVRELTPVLNENDRSTPRLGDRTTYEITVETADERDAGTKQNVEIVLVGENNQETKPKLLENTSENKVLRRGQTDVFLFKTKSVGNLKKIYLRHVEKYDNYTRKEDLTPNWICFEVKIKDLETGAVYKFPVMDQFGLNKPPKQYKCDSKKESMVNMTRNLKNVNYEVIVVTGSEKGAGTNANAFITIYGQNGDSGKRPLKKGFERSQSDKFLIECLELGELKKVHIEHDNSSFKKDWFVDRIEVIDPQGNKTVFPCNKWLSKTREDGEIGRDVYPVQDENNRSKSPHNRDRFNLEKENFNPKSPRGSRRDLNDYDERPVKGLGDRDRLSSKSPRDPRRDFDDRIAMAQFDEIKDRAKYNSTRRDNFYR